MGNIVSGAVQIQLAPIENYVSDLGDYYNVSIVGNTRFLKTVSAETTEGKVVIKTFVKPNPQFSLKDFKDSLEEYRDVLTGLANVLPGQVFAETDRAGFMIRQYFFSSLYDRISTRPFLTAIEKKWITFQLLNAVSESHSRGVYHGDIKLENVMVTSWNWVYLTDFAPFKPSHLPIDYPEHFSYFFDTTGQRNCYLAPERFYQNETTELPAFNRPGDALTPEMDMFSLGCVIAELFLDGRRLFDLAKLLRYRDHEYDPLPSLEAIEDPHIREMVQAMIDIDPLKRKTADDYLAAYRGPCFPYYFHTFVHQYLHSITDHSNPALLDPDAKFERINQDFDKIAFFLGFLEPPDDNPAAANPAQSQNPLGQIRTSNVVDTLSLDIALNIPNFSSRIPLGKPLKKADDGALIFVSLICSLLRNLRQPSSKLAAIDCLLAIGIHLDDSLKLERVVPYLVNLISDPMPMVRSLALRALTQLLATVEEVSLRDAEIFPEYILPNLQKIPEDPAVMVRTTYALCLASLAETGLRFLEYVQMLKNQEYEKMEEDDIKMLALDSYDAHLSKLQDLIQEEVVTLLSDQEPVVNRYLLSDITTLCVFFGRQRSDLILSHIATILNKHDWQLKCAFFESVISVGTFAGSKSLERFILPLMVDALLDDEETVVEKILSSFTCLTELGLFQKKTVRQLIEKVAPLLCHPGIGIRYGVIAFISAGVNPRNKLFSQFDYQVLILPLLRPYLTHDLVDLNENSLLESLQEPLGRLIYNQALVWAKRRVNVKEKKEDEGTRPRSNTQGKSDQPSTPVPPETEDEFSQQLKKLGIQAEVEKKLLSLKSFIFKNPGNHARAMAQSETKPLPPDDQPIMLKNIAPLRKHVYIQKQTHAQVPPLPTSFTDPGRTEALASNIRKLTGNKQTLRGQYGQDDSTSPMTNEDWALFLAETSPKRESPRGRKETDPEDPETAARKASAQAPFPMTPTKSLPSLALSNAVTAAAHPGDREAAGSASLVGPALAVSSSIGDQNLFSANVPASPVPAASARPRTGSAAVQGSDSPSLKAEEYSLSSSFDRKKAEVLFSPLPVALESLPAVKPNRRHRRVISKDGKDLTLSGWKPEGTLVAHLVEHRGAVTCLAIAKDYAFFVTGSADGTLKIWDCQRLEKNVSNRSRVTYSPLGGQITALTFLENTHCFVAAASSGTVHICKVECASKENSLPKYGKCLLLQKFDLDDGYVVALEHYTQGNLSVLVFATSLGSILAHDLKTGALIWTLNHSISDGTITAMLVDREKNYLVVGTNMGHLSCFDLRFGVSVRKWTASKKGPVHQISPSSSHLQSHQIFVAGGGTRNEISLWDMERGICLKVLGPSEKDVKSWFPDLTKPSEDSPTDFAAKREDSTRAMIIPSECPFIISAGTDLKIRFWDLKVHTKSYIIAGKSEVSQPTYRVVEHSDVQFYTEDAPTSSSSSASASSSTSSSSTLSSSTTVKKVSGASLNHYDCITCMTLTEVPYLMLITASRSGVVKVWK